MWITSDQLKVYAPHATSNNLGSMLSACLLADARNRRLTVLRLVESVSGRVEAIMKTLEEAIPNLQAVELEILKGQGAEAHHPAFWLKTLWLSPEAFVLVSWGATPDGWGYAAIWIEQMVKADDVSHAAGLKHLEGLLTQLRNLPKQPKEVVHRIFEIYPSDTGGFVVDPHTLKLPEIPAENYEPSVWALHQQARTALQTGDYSMGHLFVYQGPPGTGKSRLTHDLLLLKECSFFRMESADLFALSRDRKMLRTLLQHSEREGTRPVLLVEEADISLLSKRDGTNTEGVSKLLDFGDGLLGHIYNMGIVLVSNVTGAKMDPAFREMRLNTQVITTELPANRANEVLKRELDALPLVDGERLQAPPFTKPATLAQIYAKVHALRKAHKLPAAPSPRPVGFTPADRLATLREASPHPDETKAR